MKRGMQSEKLIRETSNRYNSITAQCDKFVYFFKTETSNEESIRSFMNLLIKKFRLTIIKNQIEYRIIIL